MPDLLCCCCRLGGHTYCVVCPSDELHRASQVLLRWAVDERLNFDELCWSMMMMQLKEKRDG